MLVARARRRDADAEDCRRSPDFATPVGTALRAARAAADGGARGLLGRANGGRDARRADALRLAASRRTTGELARQAADGSKRRGRVAAPEARATRVGGGVARHGARSQAFAPLADPRRRARGSRRRVPVLLFPLRLETRFAVGGRAAGCGCTPTTASVDTFEPSSRRPRSRRRALLGRRLAARAASKRASAPPGAGSWPAHGSGRAAWIVEQLRAAEPAGERPVKAAPDDVVLVIATRRAARRRSATARRGATGRRCGAPTATRAAAQQARAALVAAVGSAACRRRSSSGTRPANLDEPPRRRSPAPTSTCRSSFLRAADAPRRVGRRRRGPRRPRAELLPDRFVLLGYVDGELVLDAARRAVARRRSSSGPTRRPTDDAARDRRRRRSMLPDELRWLVDFDARRRATGMGFRVALDADDGERASTGCSSLGAPAERATPATAQAELEALLDAPPLQPRRLRRWCRRARRPTTPRTGGAGVRPRRRRRRHLRRDSFGGPRRFVRRDRPARQARRRSGWRELLGIDPAVLAARPRRRRTRPARGPRDADRAVAGDARLLPRAR